MSLEKIIIGSLADFINFGIMIPAGIFFKYTQVKRHLKLLKNEKLNLRTINSNIKFSENQVDVRGLEEFFGKWEYLLKYKPFLEQIGINVGDKEIVTSPLNIYQNFREVFLPSIFVGTGVCIFSKSYFIGIEYIITTLGGLGIGSCIGERLAVKNYYKKNKKF